MGELLSHTDRIPGLTWRPDGGLLVSAGWDTSARVWKPGEADPVMLLNKHAEQVLCVAFGPAGGVLAAADSDHDIHLWTDPENGTEGTVLRGHADEVRALAFSPDGSRSWPPAGPTASSTSGTWPPASWWPGRTRPAGTGWPCSSTTAGPCWPAPAAPRSGCGTPTPGPSCRPPGTARPRAWRPAANFLAVGGTDHFTRLYDLTRPGSPPAKLEATKPPVGAVSVSPAGDLVVHTSPADGLVWLWNPATLTPDLILIEAADGCTLEDVAVHPDGLRVVAGGIDYLSTGDRDGAVCVWDRTTQLKAHTFDVGVYAVAVDPTGKYLAGAGLDDAVHVWDLDSGEELFALEGHTGRVNAVTFSPDGSYLVSGGDDQTVRVWDILSGRLLGGAGTGRGRAGAGVLAGRGRSCSPGNGNTTCHRLPFAKLLDE